MNDKQKLQKWAKEKVESRIRKATCLKGQPLEYILPDEPTHSIYYYMLNIKNTYFREKKDEK